MILECKEGGRACGNNLQIVERRLEGLGCTRHLRNAKEFNGKMCLFEMKQQTRIAAGDP